MTVIMSAGIVQPGADVNSQSKLSALAETARAAQIARQKTPARWTSQAVSPASPNSARLTGNSIREGAMNFWQAIQSGFSNYVTFSGRAARSEYWYWFLFASLGGMAAGIIDAATGGTVTEGDLQPRDDLAQHRNRRAADA